MSRAPLLGVVTIGQTPRPDLEALFARHARGARIATLGALDGCTSDAIAALAGRGGSYPLLVRLRDGATVEIDRDLLRPRIEQRAAELAERGAGAIVVACAGAFPPFACAAPVIRPSAVVPPVVAALSPSRRVGVVVPVPGQVDAARAGWAVAGLDATVTSAAPASHEAIVAAAGVMRNDALDLVVLDCMGHDESCRRALAEHSGRRVVLTQTIVAGIAGGVIAASEEERAHE